MQRLAENLTINFIYCRKLLSSDLSKWVFVTFDKLSLGLYHCVVHVWLYKYS